MRRSLAVVALMALLVPACSGATWGNLSVLLITCGIFFGTLSLGRRIHHIQGTAPANPPPVSSDEGGRV
jgi:hypothetical protein